MNASTRFLKDDLGGRVCMQCSLVTDDDDDDTTTLFAYSFYTKRDSRLGDSVFLAAQTQDRRSVLVEFPSVPYRLFVTPENFGTIQQHCLSHAEFRFCVRVLDSSSLAQKEMIEVRFDSYDSYKRACDFLERNEIPMVIDGAHDTLHGLDAVFNLGIPGSCVTLSVKRDAVALVTDTYWRVNSPKGICVHGRPSRLPVSLVVAAIACPENGKVCMASADCEITYGIDQVKDFTERVKTLRPTVILVRDREVTLKRVRDYAPSLFSFLFSLSPRCVPTPPNPPRSFVPGLGVFVFDVDVMDVMDCVDETSTPRQWLDVFQSRGCLENIWNEAVAKQTDMHRRVAYHAFTAAMVLRYAKTGTVCEVLPGPRPSCSGGLIISPNCEYVSKEPMAVFDFTSMYPSIACGINAGKDTYVPEGGQWNLGEFGGFTTHRPGCLAVALSECLQERLRILGDPSMETRARYLKQTINAMVGMSANKNNPYSDPRVTGGITATGRRLLQACHRTVIGSTLAGYTDSLFVKLPRPPQSADPLNQWISRSQVSELEVRFKDVIKSEMQKMAPSIESPKDPFVRFHCQHIAVVGLFTGVSHAYSVGILNLGADRTTVDVQLKGSFKFAKMECVRSFNDAIACIAIFGQFVLIQQGVLCLGDVRRVKASLPVRIMTSKGWKTAVKVIVSDGSNDLLKTVIKYADKTESCHLFLPQANAEGLVEVTHMFLSNDDTSFNDRRRLSIVEMTKTFFEQLRSGLLPLSSYVVDKDDNVMVKLKDRPSTTKPLHETARNGLSLDLEQYRQRWIRACIDDLKCSICNGSFTDASECRYLSSDDDADGRIVHHPCGGGAVTSLEDVSSSVLTRLTKMALSAILVAGTNNASEAVTRLIDMHNFVADPVEEKLLTRPYDEVLSQLKQSVSDGKSSNEYICPPHAFVCIPDENHSWFYLPSVPTSKVVLDLVYEVTRLIARHGERRGFCDIVELAITYPAHRLRVAPPPILAMDYSAPVRSWQLIMQELTESKQDPHFVTDTSSRCQFCDTAFNLEIGTCNHLVCVCVPGIGRFVEYVG